MSEILSIVGVAVLFALFGAMRSRSARSAEGRDCACGAALRVCGRCPVGGGTPERSDDAP